MLFSVFIVLEIIISVQAFTCVSPIRKVYSRVNTDAVLQFYADLTVLPTQFDFKFPDGTSKARLSYNTDKSSTSTALAGVSITGDKNGNVVVTLHNVQQNNAGVYKLISAGVSTKCNCLYILGIPVKPTVTVYKTPSVGESVTLTCSGTSTTTPSNHSLSMRYKWTVDNTDNPDGRKYSYTSNRNKITVNNIVLDDANKQFTCTATEDVTGGYTSNSSDLFSFDVYYGPDNLDFTPSDTSYEEVENGSLNQVTCAASCYPECSFMWNKMEGNTVASSTATLNLERLQSSDAGTYRCIATRSGGSSESKDLTVNVIYGPKGMSFSPSVTTYRRHENSDIPGVICNAQCWQCSFIWTGPSFFSQSGQVLNLNNLQKSMAGNYTCFATNTKNQRLPQKTKDVLIEVRYGPDLISFTPGSTSYIVDEGTVLSNIKCEADCFPACTYKWTKEGQTTAVSNTDTLSLGTIQKSFDDKYTCRATNGDTPSKFSDKHITIRVRYGPYQPSTSLIPASEHYTINDGSRLPNINCSAECYPDCSYTWIKKKQGFNSTVRRSGILSLGTIHYDDAATYICLATNTAKSVTTTTTKQVTVKVQYGPNGVIINKQSPYNIKEGDTDVVIECSSDCYPDCSYEWTNATSGSRITTNRKMTIQMVNRCMTSHYKCSSRNSARNFTKSSFSTINVIVQYAPNVSVIHSSSNVIEGQSLTLSCVEFGVPSYYNYTDLTQKWGYIQIPNSNIKEAGSQKFSSIHFSSVKLEDSGTYTCTLNNGIRSLDGKLSQTGSTYLLVEVQPKVLTEELRFTGTKGRTAKMQFSIYSYPSLDSLSMTRHDGKVLSSDDYNITEHAVKTTFYDTPVSLNGSIIDLMISNLTENDFGNYTLELHNRIGSTLAQAFIIAEGTMPLPPTNFTLFITTAGPIFQWQKNTNGGLNQSFVIETSVAGTGLWTKQTKILENDKQYQLNSSFFRARIDNLYEGVYIARIYSFNNLGRSVYVYLGTTFNIYKIQEESSKTEDDSSIGAVAAVVSVVVVVIASVAAVAISFKWRRGKNKDDSGEGLATANPNSQSHYEDLKGIMETEMSQSYETLRTENTESPANVTGASEHAKSPLKFDKTGNIYENLKVKE